MNVYFARHGLSEMNVQGLFSGHTDTPLTEKGRQQAQSAGRYARKKDLKFDAIIASPLARAHETARLIAQEVEFPLEQIATHDHLKERHFGELEGAPYEIPTDIHKDNPLLLDQIPGIETLADLHSRAAEFVEWLETQDVESVLVVAHGAIGRAIRRILEGKDSHEHVEPFRNAYIHQLAGETATFS